VSENMQNSYREQMSLRGQEEQRYVTKEEEFKRNKVWRGY